MTPGDPGVVLGGLARELRPAAVVCSSGIMALRLGHLGHWNESLIAGALPDVEHDFGDAQATQALREVMAELQLPRLTRGSPQTSLQLLRSALWHADSLIDRAPGETRDAAILRMAQEFRALWDVERVLWEEAQALMQILGDGPMLRWDLLKGHLRSRPWQEAKRLAALMAQRPELAALLNRIGRSQRSVLPTESALQAVQATGQREPLGLCATQALWPNLPGELQGIRLSDQIESLLGSELQQLAHPVLRKLWRARKAEARLLAYDSQATAADWRVERQRPPRPHPVSREPQALERGPMVICLDTSGSMQGAPEAIAKGVVLQAARVAQREQRACAVIAFGGTDEVMERELDFDSEGFSQLLELISQAFGGGTDLQTPIDHAIRRVRQQRWAGADMLIVSDGEFGCTQSTLEALDQARLELGLRVFGLLIGDRETMGLLEVADEIHWVRDWRRDSPGAIPHGSGGAGFSPVHSKSLTALFFPNALSDRAARNAGVPTGDRPGQPQAVSPQSAAHRKRL